MFKVISQTKDLNLLTLHYMETLKCEKAEVRGGHWHSQETRSEVYRVQALFTDNKDIAA